MVEFLVVKLVQTSLENGARPRAIKGFCIRRSSREDPLILRAVFFAACASETLPFPKSLQAKAKCALQDIWMAAIETYGIKYGRRAPDEGP